MLWRITRDRLNSIWSLENESQWISARTKQDLKKISKEAKQNLNNLQVEFQQGKKDFIAILEMSHRL